MERCESPRLGLQLDGSRGPAFRNCPHLRRQRNIGAAPGSANQRSLKWPEALFGFAARRLNAHRTRSMVLILVNTAAFPHDVVLVRSKVRESLDQSAGPTNYYLFRLGRFAQPKMQP